MADISKITVIKQGGINVYNFKDDVLRESISEIPCIFLDELPQSAKPGDICFSFLEDEESN